MSTIICCDGQDCTNMGTNYDKEIYFISDKAQILYREVFNIYGQHICEDCLMELNNEEEVFFIGNGIYSDWLFAKNEKWLEE